MENLNITYILAGSGVILLILIIWIITLEIRLKKIFRGKKSQDLESILTNLGEELKKIDINRQEMEKYLETVEKRLRKSIQNVGTLRFNPFEGSGAGSNQSFAIAFLNQQGDGVVVSSLYSREKVSVYAKPIKNYQSEFTLSKEEKEAMKTARGEV